MMDKSVWVIEKGTYSDYRVVGVFSSRANAEIAIANMQDEYEPPEIAEWPLDPAIADLNAGRKRWLLIMNADGNVERFERDNDMSYDISGTMVVWKRTEAPAYRGKGVRDAIRATVWATDDSHAVKIVNEYRIQMLAAGKMK